MNPPIEKTIIDGLKLPQYCGGITEVAKGLWIKRNKININKLVKYAFKVNIGVVFRRLGFLLDVYQVAEESLLKKLKNKISKKYLLLDPCLIDEGRYDSRWHLRLNILEEEFKAVIRT